MAALLFAFLATATLLWLSVFGYLLVLAILASRRRLSERRERIWPEIAVIIPTLNEESLILPKLADMRRTDYPRDRMRVVVVDGGSDDRTRALIRQEIGRGEPVELVGLNGARGRTDQIIRALALLTQEIVIVTDVDSVLEPSSIRELVGMLVDDPRTGMVGATVRPASPLTEERLHWRLLNYLWWLEGEVLSSAGVSGVCYACRRKVVLALARGGPPENIRLPFAISAGGYRTRICRAAHATETRVPQTVGEFLHFRRHRGAAYVHELRRLPQNGDAPMRWRLARLMRLWHFLVAPKLSVGLATAAAVLLLTPLWPWPLMTAASFAVSLLAALSFSTMPTGDHRRWWSVVWGAIRWLAWTWLSMLTWNPRPSTQSPRGGRL